MTECDGGVKGARARGGDVNHAHSRTRTGGRVYREMSRLRGQTARRRERICQRRTFYHIHSSRRGSATTYDDQSSLMTRVITPTTSLVLGVSTFGFAGAGRSLRRARGDVRRVRGSRRVLCGRALRASRGGCRESWVSRPPAHASSTPDASFARRVGRPLPRRVADHLPTGGTPSPRLLARTRIRTRWTSMTSRFAPAAWNSPPARPRCWMPSGAPTVFGPRRIAAR